MKRLLLTMHRWLLVLPLLVSFYLFVLFSYLYDLGREDE